MPTIRTTFGRSTSRRRARRGSVYVLVLGTALVVTILGLSAVTVTRVRLRGDEQTIDAQRAALLALAAAERAVAIVSVDPNWRDKHGHGTETSPEDFDGGTTSYRLVDLGADKDLQTTESIRVEGIGRFGGAVRVHSVQMSTAAPLSCLGAGVHAQGDVVINGAEIVGNDIISTNGACNATGADVYPAVEARGDITGSTYHGPTRPFGAERAMPDPAGVFDYYVANGTPITVTDLPRTGGSPNINRKVLSPKNNPYGSGVTNPEGIYVIDCGGEPLGIQTARIVGTLVVLNTPEVKIYNSVQLEPAVPNYPVLLVQGPILLRHTALAPLNEAFHGLNFNPPGAPYRGEVDQDTDDLLDTTVVGLVYATGDVIHETAASRVDGVVVAGGRFESKFNPFDLRYDARYVSNPPPGFRAAPGPMIVAPGTWRWEPAP